MCLGKNVCISTNNESFHKRAKPPLRRTLGTIMPWLLSNLRLISAISSTLNLVSVRKPKVGSSFKTIFWRVPGRGYTIAAADPICVANNLPKATTSSSSLGLFPTSTFSKTSSRGAYVFHFKPTSTSSTFIRVISFMAFTFCKLDEHIPTFSFLGLIACA